ncbi:MAG: ParB N-terminal domain-containing protein [Roseibium sp.]|nr:ParB N-terminal domain-containing protein [Roseibium sp.]
MANSNYPQQLNVSPDRLEKNPWNSNIVSPENEEKLDEAVRRMGFFKPIVVREIPSSDKFQILGGEHRWEASTRVGLEEVPIFNLGPIDDVKAKEISLADNARYGSDDELQLAVILEDIGESDTISSFLPYTNADITSIFAASDIALDDLEIDEEPQEIAASQEESTPKPAKTHTVMRFKVPLGDAERITELISRTQKIHGYTSADEMTNAGDALVHLLMPQGQEENAE